MQKAIVLYNSRTGNTEKVAMKIAEGLGAECQNNKNIPDLKDYQLIAVGTWVMVGKISPAGQRYLKKLHRKHITGKKVALFMTSGAPENVHPATEKTGKPKKIYEVTFEAMEQILTKKDKVVILAEKFHAVGASRIFKKGKVVDGFGHPAEEELAQAKAFGVKLKQQLK